MTLSAARARAMVLAPWLEALLLGLVWLVVYWFTGPPRDADLWPLLAEAFIDGRTYLDRDRPWLELIPRPEGGQYSPMPPMPAVLIAPVIAITGNIDGNTYASVIGAANVGLAYWLLVGWGTAHSPRRWLTIGFAGTTHWWAAGVGGPHLFAQTCGVFFTLLALNLAVRRSWPVVAGLMVGFAAASRLPTGFVLPVVMGLFGGGWRPHRTWLSVLSGAALPAAAVAWYNVARFGSLFDFGYARIPSGGGRLVTDERWFREGLLSPTYIPRHLKAIFIEGFAIVTEPPHVRPSWTGASLVLTAPFLFLSVLARGRWVWLLWLGVALVMLPNVLHGSWGFVQFGYRFILDAVPLLLLLLGTAFRKRIGWVAITTILFGIAVHAYGMWTIWVLNFVSY